jgi:uncharacterized protein YdaL
MIATILKFLVCLVLLTAAMPLSRAAATPSPQPILILVEGTGNPNSPAVGDGRQLANLLGHFSTVIDLRGVNEYTPGLMRRYARTFYIGFNAENRVPRDFLDDVMRLEMPLVWIHTGFAEFSRSHAPAQRFGFSVSGIDSSGEFTRVRRGGAVFTREEPNINRIGIVDRARVEVLASAVSSRHGGEIPYIVRSGPLIYVADSPFALAGPTDRYLLFADMLHDILGEDHEESHSAIIRIEDVNPMENPDKLRDIADLLSARGVPFLVGVTPIYVNPGEGIRVTLSDKPEIVDALKYMVRNGGTIVMHGVTHQYKGITASDYEFWDESTNGPIREETSESIVRRLEMGVQEFMKNGLYPLLWETPHYAASGLLYSTIGRFFTAAVEQRLVIENSDYSQFFPYVIRRDLYGQTVYPENLGFVPLELEGAALREHVHALVNGARAHLNVRDGFASHFFHAFVDLHVLEELVDSIQGLGYTYLDLREETLRAQTRNRVVLTGHQSYTLELRDQYLHEVYFNGEGEPVRVITSPQRLTGAVTRYVESEPGGFYKAEPSEWREREQTFPASALAAIERLAQGVFGSPETWREARPVILWNHFARGAAYNDQASLAAVFGSVNIPVDTLFTGQPISLTQANLVIVPYAFVDSLRLADFDLLVKFVENGGCMITDGNNDLAVELGIRFGRTSLSVGKVQDRYYPEERIVWRFPEPLVRFECDEPEVVFCTDAATDAPLVIGKRQGSGHVIFIGTRFDPYSQFGVSHYPFLLEYVRRYFALGPVVRRDNLEMYFDPGFRHNQSIEHLVRMWVQQGIRRIHAAAWHHYPKYTYDYERLIRLAHANGILVYAWLEPPQVSQKFWLEHPEWREKNPAGEDVRPSWRYPVALTDTTCLAAIAAEYVALLEKHDWDGVNLAELYFEAGRGFDQPRLWSPMHPTAIAEFRLLHGLDPRAIFDSGSPFFWKRDAAMRGALVDYRVRKLEQVYERLLPPFASLRTSRPGFEVIVTAMDSYGSPELREQIGVDMNSILSLQRRFGFVLQVEDPERLWSTDPTRYVDIGKRYSTLVRDTANLMLDLNILGFRSPDQVTDFATLVPTGSECFQLIRSAAIGADRSTVYSESSVNPQDMLFAPFANAARIQYHFNGGSVSVSSPVSFSLKIPPDIREISIDGMLVIAGRENRFLVPAGTHAIDISPDAARRFSDHQIQPRILSISGELLSAVYAARTITFEYASTGRTLVSFDREPVTIRIDGVPQVYQVLKGNDCFSVFLPSGRHAAEVVAGDLFSYGINMTSFWSSTGIALFGLAAALLLLVMYGFWIMIRKRIVQSVPGGEK